MGNPSILIAFFLAIGSTLPGQAISCSNPWHTITGSNSCYLSSWGFGTSDRSRDEALAFCQQKGGTLASVGQKSATEEDPVMTFVNQAGRDVWVGARYKVDNKWKWMSGTVLSLNSPLWGRNEPSGDGYCVEARPSKPTGKLNDQDCPHARAFLCEK